MTVVNRTKMAGVPELVLKRSRREQKHGAAKRNSAIQGDAERAANAKEAKAREKQYFHWIWRNTKPSNETLYKRNARLKLQAIPTCDQSPTLYSLSAYGVMLE